MLLGSRSRAQIAIALVVMGWTFSFAADDAKVPSGISQMDAYLQKRFASPNDFELVDELFVRIGCDGGPSLLLLPKEKRVIVDIWGSQGLIDNGGFRYLFEGDLANFPGIADSFDTVGAASCAAAVREALRVFPNSSPQSDVFQRIAYLQRLSPEAEQRLKKCSAIIWLADREIQKKTADYARKHRSLYAHLRPQTNRPLRSGDEDLPPPPADSEGSVAAWLRSIDVDATRWDGLPEHRRGQLTHPRPGNPIVWLKLSTHRNSTDADLAKIVEYASLRETLECTLTNTYVTAGGLKSLARLPRLESLDLSQTDVTDETMPLVASFARLRELSLARTAVSSRGLAALSKLTQLEQLSLYETRVTDVALTSLDHFPNLRSLDLRGTAVEGGVQLRVLERLRSLESLLLPAALRNNSNVRYLRERLPKVRIETN